MSLSSSESAQFQAVIEAIENLEETVAGYSQDLTTHESDLNAHPNSFVGLSGNQTIGGRKTFSSNIQFDTAAQMPMVYGSGDSGGNHKYGISMQATTSVNSGAVIRLFGKDNTSQAGQFEIWASIASGSGHKKLIGTPGGTLTWDGDAIQTTSDERLKTSLESIPDSVMEAWGDVQWGQFKMLEAVERKGTGARKHVGLIAQQIMRAFESHDLDALEYGIVCHEQSPARDIINENGDVDHIDEVDIWMVRYAEAQAMECAYQRWLNRKRDAEIEALKARLSALEQNGGAV